MLRVFITVTALLTSSAAHGQPPVCNEAPVVFVGRAGTPITFHVSGEPFIERARQNLQRVEEDVARERAELRDDPELDERTRDEREVGFIMRLVKAQEELRFRRGRTLPPRDVTFIPMHVEQAFRGVTESTVMVWDQYLPFRLEPDEVYLITGGREKNWLTHVLDIGDVSGIAEYIQAASARRTASVPREVEFLAATRSGATIFGQLSKHSWDGGPQVPMPGVRLLISSGAHTLETASSEHGSFVLSGIPAGVIEINPVLPADLTVVNKRELSRELRDGACRQVHLSVGVNGRVRGRIISASNRSVKGATIVLDSIDLTDFLADPNVVRMRPSHSYSPRVEVAAREDGTFEFSGVPPATYLLTASVSTIVGGKETASATYYPGTAERSAARPITVGTATEHDGFDFVVQDQSLIPSP